MEAHAIAGETKWFPMSCGCRLDTNDTLGSLLGVVVCKHGRRVFAPHVPGVQVTDNWQMNEMRTHLL